MNVTVSPSDALTNLQVIFDYVMNVIQNEPLLMLMFAGGLLAICAGVFELFGSSVDY